MYPFLESICFDGDQYRLLPYHQERIDRAFSNFFPNSPSLQLESLLPGNLPTGIRSKIRMLYGEADFKIEANRYNIRPVHSLRVIEGGVLDYAYKYSDRSEIDRLFDERGGADDIMITKNGFVTDSSYANLLFLHEGRWFTPKTALLFGVKRQFLLQKQTIQETEIHVDDLPKYESVSLINSMLDPGEVQIPVENIKVGRT